MLIRYFFFGLITSLLTACQPAQPRNYQDWVTAELAQKERKDSLFLDIHFGMSSKDFYAHCWDLNREGQLMDGNGNATARYRLEDELSYPADFEFYPRFAAGKIVAMPAFVEFDGWAPWNKELSAESRIEEVKNLLEDWYGIRFYPVKPSTPFGKAYLNIDSNRKILLYYEFDHRVDILYTDLTNLDDVPNELLP